MSAHRSKYRAKRCEIDGYTFDSLAEGRKYNALQLLQRAGKITNLEVHPKFPLTIDGAPLRAPRSKDGKVGRQYIVEMDFAFFDLEAGKRVILDCKGFDNPLSRLKRSLVEAIYHVHVTVEKTA